MAKDIVTKLKELKVKTRSKESAIIECREEIKKGLAAGFSIKEVWLVLKQSGQTAHSYSGFVKAVKKHITHSTEPQIAPKEKPQPVVEVVKPPPPPAPAVAKPDPGYEVATRPVRPIEPERPKPARHHEEKESEEVAEARRQRGIAEYRAQKGKPLRFKSDYTLRMEAEKKAEQERNTQNGKDSSDSGQ